MRSCLRPIVKASAASGYCLRGSKRPFVPFSPASLSRHASSSRTIGSLEKRISEIPLDRFRNFCIVAHVDHGKSTLSDRLLELTGTIEPGGKKQFLDKLDVERERGITVKAQTCSMLYKYKGEDYLLHLVDTPGHVDFRAEVTRSYAACGGALLLVDARWVHIGLSCSHCLCFEVLESRRKSCDLIALFESVSRHSFLFIKKNSNSKNLISQGVQAQTVANFYLAFSQGLQLVPVINKIDLQSAEPQRALEQIQDTFELDPDTAVLVSARTGLHVQKILPAVIEQIPA